MVSDVKWRTREATWWDRVFAHLIDQLTIYFPFSFVVVHMTMQMPKSAWVIPFSFAGLLAKLVCETYWGGTLGKWLMKVQLVSAGRRISFLQVLARNTPPIFLSLLNAYSLSLYLESPYSPYIANAEEYGLLSTAVTPLYVFSGTCLCFVFYFLECAYAMVNARSLPLHDILFQIECEKRERRMLGSKRPTEDEAEAIDWGKIGSPDSTANELTTDNSTGAKGAHSGDAEKSGESAGDKSSNPITTTSTPLRKPKVKGVSCLFTLLTIFAILAICAMIVPRVLDKNAARKKAQVRIAGIVEPQIESQKQAAEKRRKTLAAAIVVLKEKSVASADSVEYSSGFFHADERRAKIKLDASEYADGGPALVMFAVSSIDPTDRLQLTAVDANDSSSAVHELKVAGKFGVGTFSNLSPGSYRVAFQTQLAGGEWKDFASSHIFAVKNESKINGDISGSYQHMQPRVRVNRTRANPDLPVQVIYEGIPAKHNVQFVAAPYQLPFGSESDELRKTLTDSAGSFDYEIDSQMYENKRAGQMELRFYFFEPGADQLPQPEVILPCSVLAKNYQDFEIETYQSVFKVGQDIPISITGKYGRWAGDSYLMLVNQNLKTRPVAQLTRSLTGVEPGLYEIQFVRGSSDKTLLSGWTRVRIEMGRKDGEDERE
jgi:hypothetical protein